MGKCECSKFSCNPNSKLQVFLCFRFLRFFALYSIMFLCFFSYSSVLHSCVPNRPTVENVSEKRPVEERGRIGEDDEIRNPEITCVVSPLFSGPTVNNAVAFGQWDIRGGTGKGNE
jgi:hypothetical protein